jgi:hypothetical protein
MGMPAAVMGIPTVVLGVPTGVMGMPTVILGVPTGVMGVPTVVLGKPKRCQPGARMKCGALLTTEITEFTETAQGLKPSP